MAEEKNNQSNLAAKSAQAANAVRGAVKTGKAIAGAAKGAAAGGPYGAVAGLVWGNRHLIGKIILVVVAIFLLPILFILMLPALIFGGLVDAFTPDDPTVPVLNDSAYITENMTSITNSVSDMLSEALEDVLKEIEDDFSSSTADQREIINPHENAPAYNANAFVSQFCASKNKDFESITFSDMESTLRNAKGELYSYTSKEETRTRVEVTVTVDASTGKETETSTTVTEDWKVYTIVYNGEDYFADNVFHLDAEQKELANNYAQNLSLFLGDGMFQRLPNGYEAIPSLGDVKFTDGQTEVVYFNQLDEKYAGQPYGTDDIGGYGCGPTAMAIVVSSLTEETVDPIEMAKWSYEHGYWASGNGSYHGLIPAAAKAWELAAEGCGKDDGQKISDALSDGKLVVALMDKGHFTQSGHFIVLRGVQDGKILVADPASYANSEQAWDLSLILDEAREGAAAGGPFWIIG